MMFSCFNKRLFQNYIYKNNYLFRIKIYLIKIYSLHVEDLSRRRLFRMTRADTPSLIRCRKRFPSAEKSCSKKIQIRMRISSPTSWLETITAPAPTWTNWKSAESNPFSNTFEPSADGPSLRETTGHPRITLPGIIHSSYTFCFLLKVFDQVENHYH